MGDDATRWAASRSVLRRHTVPEALEMRARAMELGESTTPLATLVPAARIGTFDVPVASGWHNMNPTIAVDPAGGFRAVVRQVNYELRGFAYHFPGGETVVRTRNVLVGLSEDLSVDWSIEIDDTVAPLRRGHGRVMGFEDLRLFHHAGRWRVLASVAEAQPDARPRIAMLTVDDAARLVDPTMLAGPDPNRVEKNWAPIIGTTTTNGDPMVLYSHWPLEVRSIILPCGSTTSTVTALSPVITRFWRGGSQLVPFDDGYLAVIHETLSWGERKRFYVHRFVVYDRTFTLQAATPPFTFTGHHIEFAAGLALTPSDAVVTFGIGDQHAALAVVPLAALRPILLDGTPLTSP